MEQGKTVYTLVKSLSQSEKRYFKRYMQFGSGKKQTHNTLLFDVLSDLPGYHEEMVKKRLAASGLETQLPVLQNRLFESLLRCLRLINRKDSIDRKLKLLIMDIELLMDRNLYDAALKRLKKARKLAEKFERKAVLLELFQLETHVFLQSPGVDTHQLALDRQKERIQTAEALLHQTQMTATEAYSKFVLRSKWKRPDNLPEPFLGILEAGQNTPISPQNAFFSWSQQKRALSNLSFIQSDYESAYGVLQELFQAWTQRPIWIDQEPETFLSLVNNYLSSCWLTQRKEEFIEQVQTLRSLPVRKSETRVSFDFLASSKELMYAINFLPFEEGLAYIDRSEKWLRAGKGTISLAMQLGTAHNIMMYFFVYGEFRTANRWLLQILQTPGKTERTDIRDFARLFQLILQYELGNLDLQEYLLRSARRYFRRTEKMAAFEKALIELMKAFVKYMPGTEEYKKSLEQFLEALNHLKSAGSGPMPLATAELSLWCQAKLEGISSRALFERMKTPARPSK